MLQLLMNRTGGNDSDIDIEASDSENIKSRYRVEDDDFNAPQ